MPRAEAPRRDVPSTDEAQASPDAPRPDASELRADEEGHAGAEDGHAGAEDGHAGAEDGHAGAEDVHPVDEAPTDEDATRPRQRRRLVIGAAAAAVAGGLIAWWYRMPPDTTPAGAYMRIAANLSRGAPEEIFAYLEEDAQHACFTILDYARQAQGRIEAAYPEGARAAALAPYAPIVATGDARAVFVLYAEQRGWLQRLRQDLSGIAGVEIAGERATVTTARGSRYTFRRRPNGIWGLTLFTAELVDEAAKLARDWDLIVRAAQDYDRARQDR